MLIKYLCYMIVFVNITFIPVARADWESIEVSLQVISEPSLLRPVPLVGQPDEVGESLTIMQGDIVALYFTIVNRSDDESPPMLVESNPLQHPLSIIVVGPDGDERKLPSLEPRRRRLPTDERPMAPNEECHVGYFVYHDEIARHFTYAFPKKGTYSIYVLYDAASASQKAAAMREGTPREHLYVGTEEWDIVVDARNNISIPPIFRTNRVTVEVQDAFDGWHELRDAGLRMVSNHEPWHQQFGDQRERAQMAMLVARANRPWLTQWWEGIHEVWHPTQEAEQDADIAYRRLQQVVEQLKADGYDIAALSEQAPDAWEQFNQNTLELDRQHMYEGTLPHDDYYERKAELLDRYVREHVTPVSQEVLADIIERRRLEQQQREAEAEELRVAQDLRRQAEMHWLMWKRGELAIQRIDNDAARARAEREYRERLNDWLESIHPLLAEETKKLLEQDEPELTEWIEEAWREAVEQ